MKDLQEKVLATDLIFLSAIKTKEVTSVSLHHLSYFITDSHYHMKLAIMKKHNYTF